MMATHADINESSPEAAQMLVSVCVCMPAKWIHDLQMSIRTRQRLACSAFYMKRIRPVKWSWQLEMVSLLLLDYHDTCWLWDGDITIIRLTWHLLWDGVITIFGLSWYMLTTCQLWDGVIIIYGFVILTVWVLSFYTWQVKLCYWKFNRFHALCLTWSNLFSMLAL